MTPLSGEEFTEEWIYLAHLLTGIAKDLSSEKNHMQAIEQLKRAQQIWEGIISTHKQDLVQLLSVLIFLIREYVILGKIEDAHALCIQTISQWEKQNLTFHQQFLLTYIRYCKALIAAELTLYDEAIAEYEILFSTWKNVPKEGMNTFLPIMKQALHALQDLKEEIDQQKMAELNQTKLINEIKPFF